MSTFLRFPAVSARVALKKSAVYKRIAEGTFPAPVLLSARCAVWPEDEIDAWMQAQIEAAQPAPRPVPGPTDPAGSSRASRAAKARPQYRPAPVAILVSA
nr:AlpA family phage regulatory protein [uncultured Thiodictyon sp.]